MTSSNDADGLQTSAVRFLAEAGTTYRIALDGAGGASGNAVLHWYPSPTPPNDTRAHAELIGGRGGWTSGTTMGSTDGTVWYAWTAPGDGTLTLETNYVAFVTTVAVYRGSTLVAQDVGKASLAVTAGETLVVAVSGANGARGAFQLQWREPPANDDFAAAQPIAGESGTVTGTTEGAGVQAGEPESDYDASHSVWYRWTAPATGTYAFDSTPAGRLLVCTGASVTSLVCAGGRFGATNVCAMPG